MNIDLTDDTELTGTVLAPNGDERQFRLGPELGEAFADGRDFDGLTLTLEVRSLEEGASILQLIDLKGREVASAAPIGF
jgi:hypothetical protein